MDGAPGSGKTSALDLIMGNDPATVRHSTGCFEPPARAIMSGQFLGQDCTWEDMDADKLFERLCMAVKAQFDESHTPEPLIPELSPESAVFRPKPVLVADKPGPLPTAYDLEATLPTLPEVPSGVLPSEPEIPPLELFTRLVDQLPKTTGSMDLFNAHWVFIVDSGGQPAFKVNGNVSLVFISHNYCILK